MDSICKAYILTATDKITGEISYYSGGDTFPRTTKCIWFAKFYTSFYTPNSKGVKKALNNLTKRMSYDMSTGHDLEWKIQEVSMNEPKDVKC